MTKEPILYEKNESSKPYKTIKISERKSDIYDRWDACRASGESSMLAAHAMRKALDPELLETFARQRKEY